MIRQALDNQGDGTPEYTPDEPETEAPALAAVPASGRRTHWPQQAHGMLLVQPDDELALALEEALETAGFNVETVASIDEARFALIGCLFEMVVLPAGIEQEACSGLLACLAGSPGAMQLPAGIATAHETAANARALAGFMEALQATITERRRLACSA